VKIVVLSSLAFSLINFRGKLIEEMRKTGAQVIAVAPDDDPEVRAKLATMGVEFRTVPMARTGTDVFADCATIAAYVRLLREVRPDKVVAYTQKPIIYGGIASRIAGIGQFYALMSGLGYVFSEVASGKRLLKWVFCKLYRAGLRNASRIFVFNSDDRPDMVAAGIISASAPVIEVPGSGVDLERFEHKPLPEGPLRFVMIGRMMRDKGVWEYAEAAASVVQRHPDIKFTLIGRAEPDNETGLGPADIARLKSEYPVDVIDGTDDVPAFLARHHVFVLPTYYREGLPRTILEALAIGRAVITTDTPGCRDAVTPGVNGLLIPVRDAHALAQAMEGLVTDRALVEQMAARSRELAERRYDVRKVNALLLEQMGIGHSETSRIRSGDAQDMSAASPSLEAHRV
jgi:glycosyltransferase involved in cell wall biosynthesis